MSAPTSVTTACGQRSHFGWLRSEVLSRLVEVRGPARLGRSARPGPAVSPLGSPRPSWQPPLERGFHAGPSLISVSPGLGPAPGALRGLWVFAERTEGGAGLMPPLGLSRCRGSPRRAGCHGYWIAALPRSELLGTPRLCWFCPDGLRADGCRTGAQRLGSLHLPPGAVGLGARPGSGTVEVWGHSGPHCGGISQFLSVASLPSPSASLTT